MSKVLLQCKHPLILAQKILGQRAVKISAGSLDCTNLSTNLQLQDPRELVERVWLPVYKFEATVDNDSETWLPFCWHQTNCLSSWNCGSKEAICWVCIKRQFDSGSSLVDGVQKVASVQNCTELVTILKTIRKQGWISFYQTILWSPWRNVQCRASGQAAWAFRVTAAKQRHLEGFEDWSNHDSSKLVKWWKLNPFISSYLFHVPCFQLFPIIRILTRLINELQLRIGLVMDFKSFFVFCCGALEFLQFLSMQSESLMAALVWRSFLATECYHVIPPQIKVPC